MATKKATTPKPMKARKVTNNKTTRKITGAKSGIGVAAGKTWSDQEYKLKMKKLDNKRNRELQRTERTRIRYQDNKAYAVGKGIGEATKPTAVSLGASSTGKTAGNSVVSMRQAKYGTPYDSSSLSYSDEDERETDVDRIINRDRSR